MKVRACRMVCCVALLCLPLGSFAQDTVPAYAAFCYGKLGIKPADLPDSFACKIATANSKELTTFQDGTALQDVGAADPNRAGMKILKKCDTRAWLNSIPAGGHQCYGATYIQSVTIAGNTDFLGALLFRHKIRDSNRQDDFDDIAMILHNQKTGETCWFNTI